MKTFKYTARNVSSTTTMTGIIEANSSEEALSVLREQNLVVSQIEESRSENEIDLTLGRKYGTDKELSIMCEQFSTLLSAGLPIVRTIELIAHQNTNRLLRKILGAVANDVAAGYSMADSFAHYGKHLPLTLVESVRAGEQSGNLEIIFKRLAVYYKNLSQTKSKVKSALIYPCFVLCCAVIVVAIIMIFAVPTFTNTFAKMGVELPWITLAMIAISKFMSAYWWILLAFIVAIVLIIHVAKIQSESFHLWWARCALHLPVLGRIKLMSASAQYASTMAIMMEAGLPIIDAVNICARSINNYYLAHTLQSCIKDLEAGNSLTACLKELDIFPELMCEMSKIGEETGSLEEILRVVSGYYDNEVALATQNALSVMEPALIIFLAFIVLGILLAVYLPVFNLYGGLSTTF